MAHREVYPTRTGRYGTRMLTAGVPVTVAGPVAREMVALGRATLEKPKRAQLNQNKDAGSLKQDGDEVAALRAEYVEKFGRRPFHGWDADMLREKIAAA
jgi:hypothetical protein